MCTIDTRVRPFKGLLWWAGKHDKEASCIGTVLINDCLWIYAIVFRFGHGSNAFVLDSRTIRFELGADNITVLIVDIFYLARCKVFDATAFIATRINMIEHHALG